MLVWDAGRLLHRIVEFRQLVDGVAPLVTHGIVLLRIIEHLFEVGGPSHRTLRLRQAISALFGHLLDSAIDTFQVHLVRSDQFIQLVFR